MEGELGGVLVDVEGLGGKALELVVLEVELHKGIEELELDLGALVLLDVVGIDADRVVDVVVQGATLSSSGAVSATSSGSLSLLLAACGEERQRARSEGAADERATTDYGLVLHFSHAILL